MSTSYVIKVRDRYGTYTTQAVNKRSASCTTGEKWAALALAKKLWGEGCHQATLVQHLTFGVSEWRIERDQEQQP